MSVIASLTKRVLLSVIVTVGVIDGISISFETTKAQAQLSQGQDSVTVLLDGKVIPSKNFIHLYDSTPSIITIGHVAAHLPCDSTGETELKVVAGVAPNVAPLELVQVKELSTPGKICIYHADLPQKNNTDITDIALLNPTDTNITLPTTSGIVIHVSEFGAAKSSHG